jgi:hypothetical protein
MGRGILLLVYEAASTDDIAEWLQCRSATSSYHELGDVQQQLYLARAEQSTQVLTQVVPREEAANPINPIWEFR